MGTKQVKVNAFGGPLVPADKPQPTGQQTNSGSKPQGTGK